MKKNIIAFSAAVLVLGVLFGFRYIPALSIGSDLPKGDLTMKDIRDEDISMKDAKRKNGLLVMFTCNTCPYVIKNQERTRAICKYALQNNIGVILLNSNETQRRNEESLEAMQQYAKSQKYEWYYVVDKDNVIADAFGANRTPENFLFNKDLKLVYHGAIDDSPTDADRVTRQHLKEAMNQLLAGKDVTMKETRSMGCSIKRRYN